MITLDLDQVIELTESLVKLDPDFVYKDPDGKSGASASCMYVHASQKGIVPGCLVGAVLHKAGIPLDVLSRYDDNNHPAELLLDSLSNFGLLEGDSNVSDFLQNAQYAQDLGHTWGEALQRGKKAAGIDD